MKLYKDKELIHEIETLDFEVVPAGETRTLTFWVYNNEACHYQRLNFSVDHAEVEIIEFPENILSQAKSKLVVEWKPSITLREGLKASLRIRGKELWG